MVDSVKRKLRDGVGDGEQAPAILLRDTVMTTGGPPLLKHLLRSVCDNVSKGLSQAKAVVLVALNGTPESYANFAHFDDKNRSPVTWFQLLDCYTDRLGWEGVTEVQVENSNCARAYKDIRNLDGLLSLILELGQGSVQSRAKERFVVFFDSNLRYMTLDMILGFYSTRGIHLVAGQASMSLLLRYHSLQALMNFLSILRSHDQVAALLWLVHSDLHEPRTTFAFEYLSSMTIVVEPYLDVIPNSRNMQSEGFDGGIVRIRQKRRNGRVREQVERFYFTANGLRFGPTEKFDLPQSGSGKCSIPKVQFNLALTEKELEDRSKVLLPFEHQGNGQEGKIYDGRENLEMSYLASQARELAMADNVTPSASEGTGFGEIHYLRDSDDERPDSDEDPDDDLDI